MQTAAPPVKRPKLGIRQPMPIDWRKILYPYATDHADSAAREVAPGHPGQETVAHRNKGQHRRAIHAVPNGGRIASGFPELDEKGRQDVFALLSKMERLVFAQVDHHNYGAWISALIEAGWDVEANDAKPLDQIEVKIAPRHLACGLDLELREFQSVLKQVRLKITKYVKTGTVPCRKYNGQLCKLEQLFGVPTTPMSVPLKVVQRFLICTLQHHREKITPEVIQLLRDIGVKARYITALSTGIAPKRR